MRHPRLVAPPATLPVSVSEARDWCRVDSAEHDVLIQSLIAAAVGRLDGWSGLLGWALEPQTWEILLDRFPAAEIHLPLGPVVSVIEVAYVDPAGDLQPVPPSNYEVDGLARGGWVVPVAGMDWPTTLSGINAVRVRWVAGSGCPARVMQLIRQIVVYWFDNRDQGGLPPDAMQSILQLRRAAL